MKYSHTLNLVNAALLLLATSSMGSASSDKANLGGMATVPPNVKWLNCSKKSACTATYLSCHGWFATNKAHESDVQHWYRQENSSFLNIATCGGPLHKRPAVVCRANTCQLK